MTALETLSAALLATGVGFVIAAGVGLLRFPDTSSRLHALTKADNLGLGLVLLSLMTMQTAPWDIGKLALIWFVSLVSSATNAYLIAHRVRTREGAHR